MSGRPQHGACTRRGAGVCSAVVCLVVAATATPAASTVGGGETKQWLDREGGNASRSEGLSADLGAEMAGGWEDATEQVSSSLVLHAATATLPHFSFQFWRL